MTPTITGPLPGAPVTPVRLTGRLLRVGPLSVRWHPRVVIVGLVLAVLAAAMGVVVLGTGAMQLSWTEVVAALLGRADSSATRMIVVDIRLPRLVTGIFVGCCLGVAGSVFQSISGNALGSPDIIGFTTGSATGAVAQIILFNAGPTATAAAAVGGGLLTAAAVYLLSLKGGVTGGYRLVLIGIGVGAVLAAVNNLLLAKGQIDQAVSAQLWLSGSLNVRSWTHAMPVLVGFVLLLPVVLALGRNLNVMEMGDDLARQLGIRVERTRLVLMVAAVGMTALATAAAGPLAFVALAAPQLVRRLTRADGAPLALAALMGAVLVVVADLLTLYLPLNASMPVGLMTGFLGGSYLLYLLTRSRQV
ncbi:iron chelate uptake ABC transporter family permease subunit [Rhodococcus sp. X156]|uniref:FecCD family ABC transporter permease n=1 Tax=Rhodococcus sp. X156 TaxID=2499145 RepID=UPI001F49BCF5|nr:iron chelate uptake ABC transporter family permease subunit [Rhodococcus sp. X156]